MIPFRRRGMYQALQNGIWGLGAISGASFGGAIADTISWRWCFLLQVPISVLALVVGFVTVKNQPSGLALDQGIRPALKKVDFLGSFVLVIAISVQLVGLSIGGNELPWASPWVITALVSSFVLLALFLVIEAKTSATPIIPLRMFCGRLPIATQTANVCAGLSAYGVRSTPSWQTQRLLFLMFSSFSSCFLSSSKSSSVILHPLPEQDWRFPP